MADVAEPKAIDVALQSQPKKVLYNENSHLVFRDDRITVYPIELLNDKGYSCYSYICQPA